MTVVVHQVSQDAAVEVVFRYMGVGPAKARTAIVPKAHSAERAAIFVRAVSLATAKFQAKQGAKRVSGRSYTTKGEDGTGKTKERDLFFAQMQRAGAPLIRAGSSSLGGVEEVPAGRVCRLAGVRSSRLSWTPHFSTHTNNCPLPCTMPKMGQ